MQILKREMRMIEFPSLKTLAELAWQIHHMSKNEPPLTRQALCWVVRNRLQQVLNGKAHRLVQIQTQRQVFSSSEACLTLHRLCQDYRVRTAAPEPICAAPELLTQEAFLRVLAELCLIWCGEGDDPVKGANMFHDHRKSPGWAQDLVPTALIGSRLYYHI